MPKKTATAEERTLMEDLRDAYERTDTRAINRLISEVSQRVNTTLRAATRTYPDAEAAAVEALYAMTTERAVKTWLKTWSAGLKTYAATIARSSEARDAGLLSLKIIRDDAAYSTRSTSLDALIEANADRFGSARTLAEVDAAKRREVAVVRTGFKRAASGTLNAKETNAVIRYANLHKDNAPEEMETVSEAARSLRIGRVALRARLDRATRAAEEDAAFRTSLGLVVDDVERVEREALGSQMARARAVMAVAS